MTRDLQEVALSVVFQNQDGLAAWRRKMRCTKAVEDVGECGDYQDLRGPDEIDSWLCICLKWIGVKNRLVQKSGDPDNSDGVH